MLDITQKLFFALGGLTLWIYAISMNVFLSKNNKTNLGYYLFEELEITNKSGFDINKIRFILGIFMFIFIFILIDYLD